ncbi:MAG: leucyl aminopeptidase [Proteobacteria bacterium]|nr:leucyl aminopeptidase [Pseudomonadota bacterium]
MKIGFSKIAVPAQGAVILPVGDGGRLGPAASALDKRAGGALSRAMKAAEFRGKREKTLTILVPAGTKLSRVVLVGVGDTKAVDGMAAERLGAVMFDVIAGDAAAAVVLDLFDGVAAGAVAAHIAGGLLQKSYRFAKYRTKEDEGGKPKLKDVDIQTGAAAEAKRMFTAVSAIVDGIFFTRDLVSEPANVVYPASFAARARELAKDGIKVEVLGEAQMKKLGMGSLLSVGQGSERESQLLVMRWDGAGKSGGAPLAVVGKGVCFDTGGISLKSPPGMWDMKWDMAGAGIVAGLMRTLARRKAKVNVVGLCGLVENMPDGRATRPGDVVTSMSGQTIEVQNTDAEGRLVLADVVWYAQERFKPSAIVDLATLTGAIIQTFNDHYAGLFANDDDLAQRLAAAGKTVGERLWRMPMGEEYDRELKSLIADMKNIGSGKGGSITAAQFIQRFIQKGTAWAHLDIAGVVWNEKGTVLSAPGATGFGVRLLNRFVAENYEK